jgi:hypothetical protein
VRDDGNKLNELQRRIKKCGKEDEIGKIPQRKQILSLMH